MRFDLAADFFKCFPRGSFFDRLLDEVRTDCVRAEIPDEDRAGQDQEQGEGRVLHSGLHFEDNGGAGVHQM